MSQTIGKISKFSTIGFTEKRNLANAMRHALSGYLGGVPEGGYWVERLADEWSTAFKVKYSIPCNSATSGLLAACMAAGIGPGTIVWTTAYSMSATAACAKVLGAHIVFIDIEKIRFSMNMNNFVMRGLPKCVIVTNLFGHPAYLSAMRSWCDFNKIIMIEDNAQAPFAMEGKKYAGTIGHIGVFSLNIHKHIQCGEGGVVVTNISTYAERVRGSINHGELNQGTTSVPVGLNLRMTEPTAAIACAQLAKGPGIIAGRINLASELTAMVYGIPWIRPPVQDVDCVHVYYVWAAIVEAGKRNKFCANLQEQGFPMRVGYSPTLNRVFKGTGHCPIAEKLEDEEIITFEICGYSPLTQQRKKMREIIKRAAVVSDNGH